MANISQTEVVIEDQFITPDLWNNEFQNIINNGLVPSGIEDYSTTDSQMQTTTDPFPGSAISKPTSLQGEIERLRYQILQLQKAFDSTKTYWYQDAPTAGILNMDSANSRMGINNASPTVALDVIGAVKVSSKINVDVINNEADTKGLLTLTGGNVQVGDALTNATVPGSITVSGNATLSGSTTLQLGASVNEFSIDGSLTGNSDVAVPTEKAVRTFVTEKTTGLTSKVIAIKDADQEISAGSLENVTWTSSYDTLGEFSGVNFIPTTKGYYHASVLLNVSSNPATTGLWRAYLYHNSDIVARFDVPSAGGNDIFFSRLVYMDNGDTMKVVFQPQSGSGNATIKGLTNNTGTSSYFTVHKVI